MSDAFHRCPLRPADVGAFAYVVPPLPGDATTYLCVDLVLPMGWVNSPPFFCAASETAADLANVYLHDGTTTFVEYAPTKGAYSTSPSPTASAKRLQAVEVYMDDLMGATQGDPTQQRRATEIMLKAIKEVFPSVVGELKDSVSIKKALQGGGSWSWMKEILGWDIDTVAGTICLPPRRLAELKELLPIPPSQRRLAVDKLRKLIGKLRSMHLAVPGAIGHFYHLQKALTTAGSGRRAYLTAGFHRDIAHWTQLTEDVLSRPTALAEVVHRLPTNMGFCDASGLGAGGVWLDPNNDGQSFVWRLQWPQDITDYH